MWYQPRETPAHEGTAPAAAMVTPFSFPCGTDFYKDYYQKEREIRDQCAPPEWDKYWWSSVGYYSPALCPSGYTAGCLRWDERQGPPVEATETAVQCVPSGFMCANRDISNAVSYTSSVPMIQVRWAESDLTVLATHPLEPGADAVNYQVTAAPRPIDRNIQAVVARQNPPENSFPPDNSGNSTSSGLSSGAKAGIGIGAALGALVLLGAIGFFVWRSRRASKNGDSQSGGLPAPTSGGPRSGAAELGTHNYDEGGRHEMPGTDMAGLSTASPTVVGSELPTPPPPAVLAMDKINEKVELPSHTHSPAPKTSELDGTTSWNKHPQVPELHSEVKSPYTELPAEPRRAEMDSTPRQASGSPISRKQVASPLQPPPAATSPHGEQMSPDTGVTIMPGTYNDDLPPGRTQAPFVTEPSAEPSPEEMAALAEQHTQLEARRQRILELERIEQEQAALQQKMGFNRGDGQQPR